ncbi:hypothetical protein GIB67_028992, partial [Kingdonia uniflora]
MDRRCDDLLHGRGLWFKSRISQLRQGIEKVSDSFMHALLGSGGDIAQLVELRSCNWVVAITGWMSNCTGNSLEPQKSLEGDSNLAPFEILRRVSLWKAQYDES